MLKQSVNQNQFLNRSFQDPAEIIVLSETTDTVMSIQEAHDLVRSQDDINTPYLRDLISGITGQSFFSPSNTAYMAHVGGALTGFFIMWYWKKNQFNKNRWY